MMPTSPSSPADRSGRDRILDAAITRFAEDGVAGTSLKAVAEEAGVSQALIVHHFGSKEGLREACDACVVGGFREQMRRAAAEGQRLDVLESFRRRQEHHAFSLPYLARCLSEGRPAVDALVDELAEETVRSMEMSVANGVYRPSDHPRERAVVLLIWSLGAVTLHDHMRRLLGADLTGQPRELLPYLRGATDLLTRGLFTEAFHVNVRDAIAQLERE